MEREVAANREERTVWSRVMERLTRNGTYATSEIEPAVEAEIAKAEARGMERAARLADREAEQWQDGATGVSLRIIAADIRAAAKEGQ